ncbi:hypothetical protein CB0940_11133 [Cercospora beticola]|uniref:Uncharacterized protein n=1 Tax=Cercospora beticola TaxID=122368 RepID=A0A2G5HEI3_CERBT|nr:hypothetical protein CB0940_11133 [Cercospora beticola]PIA90960.1 hypothetical protein CB0940_11133 [Cercospora beticola]WPB07964.1 hypothetical protein RHO25_012628 [Cercospora beticola]CAK1368187.1 unnamed protein product [Cercospora beticola]
MSDTEKLCLVLMWAYHDSLERIEQLYEQLDEAELKASVARRLSFGSYSSEMSHASNGRDGSEEREPSIASSTSLDNLEEHQNYRDVASPIPEPTSVLQAIHSSTQDRIYTLLLEIVTTIPAAQALAEERLLLPIEANDRSEAEAEASTQEKQPTTSLKRKAYEICKNCNAEYQVNDNRKGDCVYHDGNKEVNHDADTWADHDENVHGLPEDLMSDSTYEEGFIWDCCDESGSADGCVVSKHVPKESQDSNKARKILHPISRNVVHGIVDGTAAEGAFRGPGGRAVM